MDQHALVTVFETDSMVESTVYRSLLEEAGIPVLERSLRDPMLWYAMTGMNLPNYQLLVRPEDAERAAELIEAYGAEVEKGLVIEEGAEDTGTEGNEE